MDQGWDFLSMCVQTKESKRKLFSRRDPKIPKVLGCLAHNMMFAAMASTHAIDAIAAPIKCS